MQSRWDAHTTREISAWGDLVPVSSSSLLFGFYLTILSDSQAPHIQLCLYFSMWLLTPPGAFQKHSTSQTSSWSDSRYVNMPHCFIVFTFGSLHRLFYFILKLCRLTWTIVVVILQTQNTEIRGPRYNGRKERRKEGSEGYVPSLGKVMHLFTLTHKSFFPLLPSPLCVHKPSSFHIHTVCSVYLKSVFRLVKATLHVSHASISVLCPVGEI